MTRYSLHSFTFAAMGSECGIHLYAGSTREAQDAASMAELEVRRLEHRYSRYLDDSILTQINNIARRAGTVVVDQETAGLLDYAFACYRKSGGLFDITSGLLRKAWDFSKSSLPDPGLIEGLLLRVGLEKLTWDPPRLTFPATGMEIDFGGMVKEYGADRGAEVCWNAGIHHGLVEMGGDIRVIGPHPDDRPWDIQIRHPRVAGGIFATVHLSAGGLATSGDYERYFEIDGRRYSHLLNPRTGWPVCGLAAVSVAAESCLLAGTVASSAMLMERDGSAWLVRLGIRHLWIDDEAGWGATREFEIL